MSYRERLLSHLRAASGSYRRVVEDPASTRGRRPGASSQPSILEEPHTPDPHTTIFEKCALPRASVDTTRVSDPARRAQVVPSLTPRTASRVRWRGITRAVNATPENEPVIPPKPRLLCFYGATCGVSRRAEQSLAIVLARQLNRETFRIVKVEVDDKPEIVQGFKITQIPTVLVIHEGAERARLEGTFVTRDIAEALSPWIGDWSDRAGKRKSKRPT